MYKYAGNICECVLIMFSKKFYTNSFVALFY